MISYSESSNGSEPFRLQVQVAEMATPVANRVGSARVCCALVAGFLVTCLGANRPKSGATAILDYATCPNRKGRCSDANRLG